MHVFISAGEPSGDLHGASLARALREQCPGVTLAGFGGERMRGAGCDLLFPLAEHAIMGLSGVVSKVPQMFGLLHQAATSWRQRRPDAVVLIDYPGYHWWLAAKAKSMGLPVVYFVPPQIWSWASHRIRKVRAYFDSVLCCLPFEEQWFRERGVNAHYVGHPYFDELACQPLNEEFVAAQRDRGGPIVGILPGSRQGEIDRNLDLFCGIMRTVHAARPDARFLVACCKASHGDQVSARLRTESLPVEVHVGRTPEIIALADMCAAVSGSVSLELLHRGTPSVVVYRLNPLYVAISRMVLNVPYISLVNLLAGRELFPEFLTSSHDPRGPAEYLLKWLNDAPSANAVRWDLAELRSKVAQPGACARAARALLEIAERRTNDRAA